MSEVLKILEKIVADIKENAGESLPFDLVVEVPEYNPKNPRILIKSKESKYVDHAQFQMKECFYELVDAVAEKNNVDVMTNNTGTTFWVV